MKNIATCLRPHLPPLQAWGWLHAGCPAATHHSFMCLAQERSQEESQEPASGFGERPCTSITAPAYSTWDPSGGIRRMQHHTSTPFSACGLPTSHPGPFAASPFCASGTRSLSFWGRPAKPKDPDPPPPAQDQEAADFVDRGIQAEPSFGGDMPAGASSGLSSGAGDHLPMPVNSEEAVMAVHDACNAVEVAALQAAKEESFFAAGYFIDAITALHDQAGLPWWGSIGLANVLTRLLTLPVMIMSQQATSRMALINLDLLPLKKMQEAMPKVKTQEQQRVLHAAMLEEAGRMSVLHRGTIGSTLLKMFGSMMTNGFVFLSIFNGVSSLTAHKAPSLTQGGMWWFTDLTVPDPYYGLPVLCALTTLAMIEYGINITGENMDAQKAGQAAYLKNVFRGMALLFLPFGGFVPSGVALLWVSNSFFSVLLGMALRRDAVRTAVGLPTMKDLTEASKRMQDLAATDPLSFVPSKVFGGLRSASAPTPPSVKPPPPGQAPSVVTPLRGSSESVQDVVQKAAQPAQQQNPSDLPSGSGKSSVDR
ncbi:60Kd inner membrane protein-domain-containing protein [Dunaliella salina]|uniref:60Kd inner membrane protein-domain-containing protein n=1 Tax=Dunaliella salina TaxID=3046 RepID=A0ABQ7H225_DUNSA|nr:60Kd inner membrane protein-domain-containing protein [Dunaliella salina]|eukprot:KAF5840918.1 60Kd inner membrane protein-domain-containing protein [Dunaliella salina]